MTRAAIEQIRPKIEALDTMPTVPAVVRPLAEMLQLPPERVDIGKVVELVSYDSTIAAQCLRMANSPLFGRRDTESVRTAIMALGLKRVQAIFLGSCLNRMMPRDRWAMDATIFWRHALGCALVNSKIARLIGYPDPEKAYLGGLLHDLGMLVNMIVCPAEFNQCILQASERHSPLDQVEQEVLGFTHCESGKLLAERWHFSNDIVEVVELHHRAGMSPAGGPLVSLVHISDLLCRLRDLGYGYYEAMGVDLAGEVAWRRLVKDYPALASISLERLTLDIDGAMDEIVSIVDSVFKL